MDNALIYPAGTTKACHFAAGFLQTSGIHVVDHPTPEITHLLLDVPSFGPDRQLRSGKDITELLRMLPRNVVVVGGNLGHSTLAGYETIDLLKDERYLAQNAAITAECALQVASAHMETAFRDTPALIIGWGRIGKHLARLLRAFGGEVAVAARKESDRGMIQALRYTAVDSINIPLSNYKLVFNTVPERLLTRQQTARHNNLLVDLASKQGMEGEDVIWARGLPGIYAPESSGRLIARAFINNCGEEWT